MADNYLEFAERLPHLRPEEERWLREQLQSIHAFKDREIPEDDAERAGLPVGEPDYTGPRFLRDHPDFDPECDLLGFEYRFFDDGNEPQGQGRCLVLYAEEYGNVTHVAWLLRKFLRQFRPDESWSCTYAATCSKPRAGEFGGGAVFVTAEEITDHSVWDDVEERAQRFQEHRQIAGLVEEVQRRGLQPEDLDDAVHEAASQLASDANNGGLNQQIAFLVEQLGIEEARGLLGQTAAGDGATTNDEE